ncbi:unnamed protein product [Cyclocybe aegerita]|uniref:Uncharacterized protein n=1 Tax=Cyclocybe aegerita TaxID=1973307 RepID=A0A8S0WZ19_CYCAE|nr:unnamed protein product [Cyclocybe aegerita]
MTQDSLENLYLTLAATARKDARHPEYRIFSHLHLNQRLADSIINEVPDLFSSPLSTIAPLVTSLKILLSTAREIRLLIPYLNPLEQVKKLYIGRDSLFFRATNNFPVKLLAECFSNITSLEVAFDFRSFTQLTGLVCAFPRLKELHFRSLWEGPAMGTGEQQPIRILPRSLKTLEISAYTKHILEWVVSLEEMPSITDLSLEVDSFETSQVNDFLKLQGPNIRRLLWKCGYQSEFTPPGHSTPVVAPNLQWNTSLEKIDIMVLYATDVGPYSSLVQDLLQSLNSASLREVSIRQYYPFDASWTNVDKMLSELTSPHFHQVSIFSNATREDILGSFPCCHEKEIIRSVYVNPDGVL